MDHERWLRLSPLLDALLELDPQARAASLASLRDEDPQVAADLEELLALESADGDFLSQPLVAPMPGPRPGTMVGPYRLERLLGEGGMGQVWMASRADGLYQRRVALKLLRPGLAESNLRLRFTRERQILARLEHPHIARLLDAGISGDGQPYLALDYVEGQPITDWCRERALPVEARLPLFLQVCQAVSHAHANLIVHRDLKPSNILVTPLDEARLLDFGIAKLLDVGDAVADHTRTGLRAFTLHYAAPEQIRGEPVTTMTDVYSLGVVLYELLADSKPYALKRETDAEWEEAILAVDPQKPSSRLQRQAEGLPRAESAELRKRARALAGDLDNIVLKALAKQPRLRYPSVEALAADLRRHLAGIPVQARPQGLRYRLRKYVGRHRWALATAAAVAAVLGLSLLLVAWQARQALREAQRAQAMQDFIIGLFETTRRGEGGEQIEVRQLLDAGARRAESQFAQQPVAQAELLGLIARLRMGLGDYGEATTLLQRQARLMDALPAAPPSLRLEAAANQGRALRYPGEDAACIARMAPWEALALQQQQALPRQASEFYSQLARCRRTLGQRAPAETLLQRSLALRRDQLKDLPGTAENLGDLAALAADAGRYQEARSGYLRAIASMAAGGQGRHPLLIELRRSLCQVEREVGTVHAAERDCSAALALARAVVGPQHPATIDAQRQHAATLVDIGRLAEARTDFEEAERWTRKRLGATHPAMAGIHNSLAIVAWERGDTATALKRLDTAIAMARDAGRSGRLADLLFNQAMVLHDAGRERQALSALRECRALRAARDPRTPLLADVDRLTGEVHLAQGRPDLARPELARAVAVARAGHGPTHPRTRMAEVALARLDLAEDRPGASDRLRALAALPLADIELRKVRWLAATALAAHACHGDAAAHAQALVDLRRVGLEVQQALPEGGAIVRELARLRGRCR